jgi:hypothetical protein
VKTCAWIIPSTGPFPNRVLILLAAASVVLSELAWHRVSRSACQYVPPGFDGGSYLAFLGRLTAEKGPEAAIRIARAAGMPLRIAAKVPRGERRYFKERLEPQIVAPAIAPAGVIRVAFVAGLRMPARFREQPSLPNNI